MRIGIVIGRIGGVDGVALETEKWITVLQRLGHEIEIITGELEADMDNVTMLPELAFCHPQCERGQQDAFFAQELTEDDLLEGLRREAAYIEKELEKWMIDKKIDVILTENATALPCHLQMGIALKDLLERTKIQAVAHDHDFSWERGDRYATRYEKLAAIRDEYFPPRLPNLKHAVINTYCQQELKKRFGTETIVVPNVMDFEIPFGQMDDFNGDLPEVLGFSDDDIPLFQITRIVRRKGIETAIDLVHRLQDKRVKLYITGPDKDMGQKYSAELKEQTKSLGLENQVFFVSEHFDNVRRTEGDKKIYSLADGYAHCRAMTYFSTYEGFGNAFVEALVAKRPIFVNNYEPVYWPDIGSKGFKTVQIDNSDLTDKAVEDVRRIINSPKECAEIGQYNFELGKKHFSYDVLEELLKELFTF